MAVTEQFTYDIDPALRKLRELGRATDRIGDVTQTVFVDVEGIDDIVEIENTLSGIDDTLDVTVDVNTSDIDRSTAILEGAFQDQFVAIDVDDSEVVRVENDLADIDGETINVDIDVDDPTGKMEGFFPA